MIGTRVKYISDCRFGDKELHGLYGKIVTYSRLTGSAGIEFDKFIDGHDCDGHGKDGRCWYVPCSYIIKSGIHFE